MGELLCEKPLPHYCDGGDGYPDERRLGVGSLWQCHCGVYWRVTKSPVYRDKYWTRTSKRKALKIIAECK